ncbi:hypothetical protein [Hymenobacter wooponensis]|uniref:Uncharacterized protein n=1 Tax=Hymenobacter wooponensis TaxID=1525360 RepID=A0A4Z0MKE3_9BACT|nr:hypothetical protein [Hymenobacter wooponensis]TGD80312.1 hypothetical protein EU557_10735 [Hymenobacter wooponensis]
MEQSPNTCTPWQKTVAYIRRHVPFFLGLLIVLAYLLTPELLPKLTFWLYGAEPITPGGADPDGAQITALHQAQGAKQFGAVVSIFLAGSGYFCGIIVLVWSLMHYITPGLPVWAKRHFTAGFVVEDSTVQLSEECQYNIYLKVWFGLLSLYAACLLVAALSQ